MAGKPKPAFFVVVALVVVGLGGFALYRAGILAPGEIDPDQQHLGYGRNLYDWLIAPLEETLERHNIRTLVFIPDGPLRSIPKAALYDGEKFLIEKYAIATTLGLNLTNPKPIAREDPQRGVRRDRKR